MDFDGDTGSKNLVHTEEAKEEIRATFRKAAYYRGVSGGVLYTTANPFSDKVFEWSK